MHHNLPQQAAARAPRSADPALASQLERMREFLVPRWIAWGQENDKPVSAVGENMCRFTAAFVAQAMGTGWRFDGGHDSVFDHVAFRWRRSGSGGGFLAEDGAWSAHHWATDGRTIIDLAAQQFGGPPVVLAPVIDPRYRSTISRTEAREALDGVSRRVNGWVVAWRAEEAAHLLASMAQHLPQSSPLPA